MTVLALLAAAQPIYLPQSTALFARMVPTPTHQRKRLIDQAIRLMVGTGAWSLLDGFYTFAAHSAQASLLNWVASNTATNAGVPFTTDRGYDGDSTNQIDTGVVGTYGISDAHLGQWCSHYTYPGASEFPLTISLTGGIQPINNTSNISARLFGTVVASAIPGSTGHIAASRASSAAFDLYKGGNLAVSLTSSYTSSSGVSAKVLGPASASTTRIAAAHFGHALSATQMASIYNALSVYLIAIGAN